MIEQLFFLAIYLAAFLAVLLAAAAIVEGYLWAKTLMSGDRKWR